MEKPRLLDSQKVMLWCEVCNTKVWLRAKTIEDILLEAMWHKVGNCVCKESHSSK